MTSLYAQAHEAKLQLNLQGTKLSLNDSDTPDQFELRTNGHQVVLRRCKDVVRLERRGFPVSIVAVGDEYEDIEVPCRMSDIHPLAVRQIELALDVLFAKP